MKTLIVTGCLFFLCFNAFCQSPKKNTDDLRLKEDSMKILSTNIISANEPTVRFRSDSHFTRILVRALKTPFSFYYPFDSLMSISRIYSPDSSFRIFTWQVSKDDDVHRRHGAIQMNTKDGSLKLFPLIDRTATINRIADTVTNNEWWIGCIYYKVLMHQYNNKSFYTLLGYDENSIRSTKKRIEVLQFSDQGNPVFGGPFFDFSADTIPKRSQSRFWIEYKKNGNARMVYDEELEMILYDHLISETNEPQKKYTFVPDGDYEGFKWEKGKWKHIEKVFTLQLQDGQAPVEKPNTENKLKPVKKSG
jgi:hypothetical protein